VKLWSRVWCLVFLTHGVDSILSGHSIYRAIQTRCTSDARQNLTYFAALVYRAEPRQKNQQKDL